MTTRRMRVVVPAMVAGVLGCSLAVAVEQVGGAALSGPPAVRVIEGRDPASPVLKERGEELSGTGPMVLVHDRLFVAAGAEVRVYDRHALASPRAVWTGGKPILSLSAGTEPGLLLVLDTTALRLVRFPQDKPARVLWSHPMDQSALTGPAGRLVVRDGAMAFVADASLPGVRVLTIGPAPSGPQTLAEFVSLDGPVHDIAQWGRRLSLLAGTRLVLVDAGEPATPRFQMLGSWTAPARPAASEIAEGRAFLCVGDQLLVFDADPASRTFLAGPVASWTAPSAVRSVRLEKADRAYVLLDGAYAVLDVSTAGRR